MRTLAVMAEKGGVGKTTVAVNLAVGMAKRGLRVLIGDLDPQGNASMVLSSAVNAGQLTMHDVLARDVPAFEAIQATRTPGLDVLPADGRLADAAVLLATELGRERRLRLAMQDIEGYDILLLDTPPTRSLLTVNALNTVGEVWTVADPGIFSLAGLVGLRESIAGVVKFLDNPTLRLAGLVVNRVQRDNLSRETEAQLREALGPLVMAATIPASVKLGEASARKRSVLDYAPGSPAAKAFEALTDEVIGHGTEHGSGGSGIGAAASHDRTRRRRAAS